MSIRVLFFASLADVTGIREAELDASAHRDVNSIYEKYAREFPQLAARRDTILFAVNQKFARPESPLQDGDEVAFFPPVSGG
jgi:molybdopterin converting factor subunit 1